MQFPLQAFVAVSAANPWTYVVFGLIGFAFGFTLEMSGFGDSRKLAAQFYFTELTVLKVMFTAIVTAMILLFGAVGLGLLDFNLVWVNETYLASGILGGVIMGIGFIIGGFCPTTSLASASTGKIDGMFFMLGGFAGAFLFAETQQFFEIWYDTAGYYGRVTLDQVFNLPVGMVVVMVVFMALFMFWGAEQLERVIGKKDMRSEPRVRLVGAGVLVIGAFAVLLIGSPSPEARYANLTFEREREGQEVMYTADTMLATRQVYVHPGELLEAMADDRLSTSIVDVRPEADYNLFHIVNSKNIPIENIQTAIPTLLADQTPNKVYVLVSNDEASATQAWKDLVSASVLNVYILDGGINHWIAVFNQTEDGIRPRVSAQEEALRYTFPAALGDRYACANPSPLIEWELDFDPKIQLQLKRDMSGGGCG